MKRKWYIFEVKIELWSLQRTSTWPHQVFSSIAEDRNSSISEVVVTKAKPKNSSQIGRYLTVGDLNLVFCSGKNWDSLCYQTNCRVVEDWKNVFDVTNFLLVSFLYWICSTPSLFHKRISYVEYRTILLHLMKQMC